MLCDFGLAEAIERESGGLTTSKPAEGTIRYLSPELVLKEEGRVQRTIPSDIWAWGCVFVEVFHFQIPSVLDGMLRFDLQIMADRIPYHGVPTIKAMVKMVQGFPPALIEDLVIPDFGKRLLGNCWSKDVTLRPTAGSCVEVLSQGIQITAWGTEPWVFDLSVARSVAK